MTDNTDMSVPQVGQSVSQRVAPANRAAEQSADQRNEITPLLHLLVSSQSAVSQQSASRQQPHSLSVCVPIIRGRWAVRQKDLIVYGTPAYQRQGCG